MRIEFIGKEFLSESGEGIDIEPVKELYRREN